MNFSSPYLMTWKSTNWEKPVEVYVYDFLHDTIETFQSCALCWIPSKDVWATVPVYELKPKIKSKKLNEEIKHD